MKAKEVLSKRLIPVLLALLICFGTAAIGFTNVSAFEYGSDERVFADDVFPGDSVNEGTTLRTSGDDYGVTEFAVYFDGVQFARSDSKIVIDRKAVLLSRKEYGRSDIYLELYFQGSKAESDADSEESLKRSMNLSNTVNLSGNIEMTEPLRIYDGKKHVINTNGHTLSLVNRRNSVIELSSGSTLIINGTGEEGKSEITGGDGLAGGAVDVSGGGKLIMKGMSISGNKGGMGGGIFVDNNSTAELTDCTISNNTSPGNGGGVHAAALSTVTLTNCTIEKNTAHDGGGICNKGTITVDRCKLKDNNAAGGGSGIWSRGTATLIKTEISRNNNAVNGGGVTNHQDMTMKDCTVSDNTVSGRGGGIFIETKSTTVLEKCTISNNAGKTGAGIMLNKGNLTVTKSTLSNNNAHEAGGALWANNGTTVKLTDVKMSENTCKTNGGCLNSHGTLSLTRCTINKCTAENAGGGVYMDSGETLTIESSEISNCLSANGGGGIHFHAGSLILMGGKTRITDSTANGRLSNIYFRVLNTIQVKGKFPSGSEIGIIPPDNCDNKNATAGFGQYNEVKPANIFHCDSNDYKINHDESCKEVNLIAAMRTANKSSYKVKIYIKVTDDADVWKEARFDIYGKSDRGCGEEKLLNTSPDFHSSIDDEGDAYTYEYDCGADYFPSTVLFTSKFGDIFPREFEGDITIKINEINVCSRHVIHKGTGAQNRYSWIHIGGDKYPVPDDFESDLPDEIDASGVATISAVDQYGLKWRIDGKNASIENISFPGEDTCKAIDNSGMKWKLSSNHKSNHISVYQVTFRSGSNVYPEITRVINANFVFLLHLNVMVNNEEVYVASGKRNQSVHFENLDCPTGYFISDFNQEGNGLMKSESEKNKETGEYTYKYDFTFTNDSVTLTAVLSPNNYSIALQKNGKDEKSSDVKGSISSKTVHYDEPWNLPSCKLRRNGYTFVGWNTKKDGTGTMFENMASVVNLSTKRGEKVYLYAIWKPDSASTTASIFSDGTALIFVGSGILLASIAGAVIYSVIKKKRRKRKE